jgi:hypothetical protein
MGIQQCSEQAVPGTWPADEQGGAAHVIEHTLVGSRHGKAVDVPPQRQPHIIDLVVLGTRDGGGMRSEERRDHAQERFRPMGKPETIRAEPQREPQQDRAPPAAFSAWHRGHVMRQPPSSLASEGRNGGPRITAGVSRGQGDRGELRRAREPPQGRSTRPRGAAAAGGGRARSAPGGRHRRWRAGSPGPRVLLGQAEVSWFWPRRARRAPARGLTVGEGPPRLLSWKPGRNGSSARRWCLQRAAGGLGRSGECFTAPWSSAARPAPS